MKRTPLLGLFTLLLTTTVSLAEPTAKKTPKEALQEFNDLIGSWRGTGDPSQGSREEKQKNFWTESISWGWQFKGDDVWLKMAIDKGKYYTGGELRYVADKDLYRLTMKTPTKETVTFEGSLNNRRLILERTDEGMKENQRLVFSLLHFNRHLYRYEVKTPQQTAYTPVYQVGATKEGVAFAGKDDKPECVVSGGLGTIQVSYKGKTFYVCCSGCRDAFQDEPEKYIKEFEARKAKEAKEK
jgi:YHS domain